MRHNKPWSFFVCCFLFEKYDSLDNTCCSSPELHSTVKTNFFFGFNKKHYLLFLKNNNTMEKTPCENFRPTFSVLTPAEWCIRERGPIITVRTQENSFWIPVNIFLCLKSGTCPCLALGRCMAFSPVFCLAAQYCQVQRFCLFCSSFGLLLFPWPISTAEEIELSLWVFTVSIVRSKRLFLLVLSHRKGLVAKWHFGVTQYVYPYGSLYLSVRRPIFL